MILIFVTPHDKMNLSLKNLLDIFSIEGHSKLDLMKLQRYIPFVVWRHILNFLNFSEHLLIFKLNLLPFTIPIVRNTLNYIPRINLFFQHLTRLFRTFSVEGIFFNVLNLIYSIYSSHRNDFFQYIKNTNQLKFRFIQDLSF